MIPFVRKDIVKKYLGIPYCNRGRNGKGLDCWGLIVRVYKDYGLELFDLDNYEADWSKKGENLIIENFYEKWKKVGIPQLGDLIFFTNGSGKIVNHAGIYLGQGQFIQATQIGVVVSYVHDWQSRIFGYYRYEN